MFDIHKDTKVSNTVNNFQKGSYASQHTTGTLEGKKKGHPRVSLIVLITYFLSSGKSNPGVSGLFIAPK